MSNGETEMTQFFPPRVVVTSNLSPPNVPGKVTSVLEWKDLSSQHQNFEILLRGNADLRAEGGSDTHRCICPALVSDTMLFKAYLGELFG